MTRDLTSNTPLISQEPESEDNFGSQNNPFEFTDSNEATSSYSSGSAGEMSSIAGTPPINSDHHNRSTGEGAYGEAFSFASNDHLLNHDTSSQESSRQQQQMRTMAPSALANRSYMSDSNMSISGSPAGYDRYPTMGNGNNNSLGNGNNNVLPRLISSGSLQNFTPTKDSSDGSSFVSNNNNRYLDFSPFGGYPASSFPLHIDEKEPDDYLHNPDPVQDALYDKHRFWNDLKNADRRSAWGLVGFIILITAAVGVFIILPVLTFTGVEVHRTPQEYEVLTDYQYPMLSAIRQTLVDPDTPEDALTITAKDGSQWVLVFSDEFNAEGRTFYEGDDQFFTAPDLNYAATRDLEWYDPDAATTADGTLQLRMDAFNNHDLFYRSGMLQSWNKFCFTQGRIVMSARLPNYGTVSGLWPGMWTMGNLGRPGYLASTEGVWPYSYDTCDAGITPNQSSTDGISYLPGQRLNSCTCKGESHPNPGVGRGAPEIDVIEAAIGTDPTGKTPNIGVASQSLQLAPFDIWYMPDYSYIEIYNSSVTTMNTYAGGPFQQALSGTTTLNSSWYEFGPFEHNFQRYGFEYLNDDDKGYLTWFVGDDPTFTVYPQSLHPNGNVGWRHLSKEPMSIIMNLGISNSWAYIDWPSITFPVTFRIDYVRVYQPKDQINVGCDPPDYPTYDYIQQHLNIFENVNLTLFEMGGYTFPKNKLTGYDIIENPTEFVGSIEFSEPSQISSNEEIPFNGRNFSVGTSGSFHFPKHNSLSSEENGQISQKLLDEYRYRKDDRYAKVSQPLNFDRYPSMAGTHRVSTNSIPVSAYYRHSASGSDSTKSRSSDSSPKEKSISTTTTDNGLSLDWNPFGGYPASSFPLHIDEKEADDYLHNPDPVHDIIYDKNRFLHDLKHADKRTFLGLFGFIVLLMMAAGVFIVLPVLTFANVEPHPPPIAYDYYPILTHYSYPVLSAIRTDLIDPDTPQEALTMFARDNSTWVLVFSDEFNAEGRTFYPGDDQFFTAPDIHYGATNDLEWYDPDAVTTANGTLVLRMDAFQNHDLFYRSGMLQSWNKFCFTQGKIVMSALLPNYGNYSGLWPGLWTMGNLGRPGYLASTEGIWPYSYNSCDAGITPNQSSVDGISYLPGQRLNVCTCPGEDHPNPGVGRGAPEIDLIEGTVSTDSLHFGIASQSLQVAPFDIWYIPDYSWLEIYNSSVTTMNTYAGGPFQQAVSATTILNETWFEFGDGVRNYQKYALEYINDDTDGYIRWFVGDDPTLTMYVQALHPNGNIGQRPISKEPMSMVMNLGISNSWTYIEWVNLYFPLTFKIDYVRVYQPKDQINVGCDPPGFPTQEYINNHANIYNNENLTLFEEGGYTFPKHKLFGC
ncbi:Beta-glucan synthesis-associated protein KRE6 [Spathaspora sp. JA1]|nr:Beta-glucan synthesis-associated protein KRE6 [Spathaspora sp. JA1]